MATTFDSTYSVVPVGSFANAVAVTPTDGTGANGGISDANGNHITSAALYVGGAGALKVIMANGVTVTFSAVPAGTTIPIQVTQVLHTGTAATAIVALY